MKIISYKIKQEIDYGEANLVPVFIDKRIKCTLEKLEANEEIAKREAYNGEYTIEDDGELEPIAEPTQLDRLESQIAYLAMMTGNTDILEV